MADISDDLLRDVLQSLKEANSRFGFQSDKLKKSVDALEDAVNRSIKSFSDISKQLDTFDKGIRRGSNDIKNLGSTIRNWQDELNDLAETTENLSDLQNSEYVEAQKRVNQYRAAFNQDLGTTFLKDTFISLGKNALELSIALTQSLLTNLTSSASGFKVAADVYTTTLDYSNRQTTAVADAAGALGTGLVLVNNGPVRTLGVGLTLASGAVKYFSQTLTEAAKFSIDFLSRQAEALVNSYNTASSAGLTFAQGMDEFAESATAANLTYDQFATVIKNSAVALAQSGYTVSGGVKELGKVSKALREGRLDEQLIRLGFGFEEQAELAAQTMADIRRAGMTARPEQVAQATADYAKNLRTIANLTGEEAKQKMDAARAATEEYAFRQKVMQIARQTQDPTLFQRIQQAMTLLDPTQQRAVVQQFIGGTITDLSANLRGLNQPAEQFVSSIQSGAFEVSTAMQGFLRSNDTLLQGADSMGMALNTASALTGAYSEQAKSYTEALANSTKINSETFAKAVSAANNAVTAQGEFTNSVVEITRATQDLKMQIQTETKTALNNFANVVSDTITHIRSMLNEYVLGGGTPSAKGFLENYGRDILEGVFGLIGAGAGLALGTAATAATGGGGAIILPSATIGGGVAGQSFGAGVADLLGLPKKAEGGITTGPTLAGEAGPEAVIPLKQGSVPISLDIGPLIYSMNEQVAVSKDLLDEMREAVDIQRRLLQNSY